MEKYLPFTANFYVSNQDTKFQFLTYKQLNQENDFETFSVPLSALETIAKTEKGSSFHLEFGGPVLFDSIQLTAQDMGIGDSINFKVSDDLLPALGTGMIGLEGNKSFNWIWCDKDAEVDVYNASDDVKNVHLSFVAVNATEQETYNFYIHFRDIEYCYKLSSRGTSISLDLALQPGDNKIQFTSDTPKIDSPDPRSLYYSLQNLLLVSK